ncbi:hypothetical protein IKW75_02435 [Candidatus Saccharibacteria bacterium]|nr:hypothetical protein [Candidatus Saccharibacteria bacterium]
MTPLYHFFWIKNATAHPSVVFSLMLDGGADDAFLDETGGHVSHDEIDAISSALDAVGCPTRCVTYDK